MASRRPSRAIVSLDFASLTAALTAFGSEVSYASVMRYLQVRIEFAGARSDRHRHWFRRGPSQSQQRRERLRASAAVAVAWRGPGERPRVRPRFSYPPDRYRGPDRNGLAHDPS